MSDLQDAVDYLSKVDRYLKARWPEVKAQVARLQPRDWAKAIEQLHALNAQQEHAKDQRGQATAGFDEVLGQAILQASSCVQLARAYFRLHGQGGVADELPRRPGRPDVGHLIEYAARVRDFAGKHPEVPGIPRDDLDRAVTAIQQARAAQVGAKEQLPPMTRELDRLQRALLSEAACWVALCRNAAVLAGAKGAGEQAPRQPGGGRRVAPAAKAAPPAAA